MRAPSTPFLRALTGPIVAVLLLGGCATLDDAGQVIGRADLVNDLAARLDRSGELTYSADYQLPAGRSATIAQAQQPTRTAYLYPGGKVTVTAEATTRCETTGPKPSCVLSPPPTPSSGPPASLLAGAREHGLVTPPLVIGLLTAAALDPDSVIEQNDTTVAGRHATCVRVEGVSGAAASDFDACVTTEGVLGSFTGVVDGTPLEISLTRYRDTVDNTAFDLPGDAGVVDHRPGTQ
ncbi:MAG TPA: hypothetical protein VGD43_03385 [Micromonospora sp.]